MKMKVRRFLLLQKPPCHPHSLPHQIRSLCGKITTPKVNQTETHLYFFLKNPKPFVSRLNQHCGFVLLASKPLPPAPAPDEYLVSPITGEKIPASKMQEHMRIGLLDPRWLEQRDRSIREKQSDDEVYAPGQPEPWLHSPSLPPLSRTIWNGALCVMPFLGEWDGNVCQLLLASIFTKIKGTKVGHYRSLCSLLTQNILCEKSITQPLGIN